MMLRVKRLSGQKIAGPFKAEALRTGEWTTVDLGDEGIIVGKTLPRIRPERGSGQLTWTCYRRRRRIFRPQLAVYGRLMVKAPSDQGNFMIRALVDYELSVPVITSPKDGFITNQRTLSLKGHPRRIRPFISLTGMKKPEQRKRRQTALSQKKYR
ncbi:hypothetical protein PO124_01515 [Bacillus licheniformis]|nr:hypothetical protein [Bacillus licheniformis]